MSAPERGTASSPPRPRTAAELKRVMAAEAGGREFLILRSAAGELQVVTFSAHEQVTIGRRPSNHVPIEWDAEVSRVHATLEPVAGDWTIADDGLSRNGTFVNATRISGRVRLRDGDQIRCGSTSLTFRDPVGGESDLTAPSTSQSWTVQSLTDSQRRVLVALCRPFSDGGSFAVPATNQEIADEVFLSVDAVKTHLRLLFQRFELQDLPRSQKRTRLAELAFQWGLVSDRDL